MKNFTSPLDNIRVASPCPADWNQMFGNDRKRFCGQCKLNVYNLSDMTRTEAENLLLNSEGRVCVRYYRRADGTVLTKNCPVGWQAVKQRTSNIVTAVFSVVAGVITGVLGFNFLQGESQSRTTVGAAVLPQSSNQIEEDGFNGGSHTMGDRAIMGNVATPVKVRGKR